MYDDRKKLEYDVPAESNWKPLGELIITDSPIKITPVCSNPLEHKQNQKLRELIEKYIKQDAILYNGMNDDDLRKELQELLEESKK